jgi:hypothetical protein
VELNGVKGAPSDVIIGSIDRLGHDGLPVDGDPVCTLEGSWLGFLDFGGIRSEFGPLSHLFLCRLTMPVASICYIHTLPVGRCLYFGLRV